MQGPTTTELVQMIFTVFRRLKDEMSYTNNLTHLSILQIQTLVFIHHSKKCSMSDIAGYFHIELSSATSLVNKLCEQKLVERHSDPKDRRLVLITVTGAGLKLLESAMNDRRKKMEKMLSYLSEREKTELLRIFTTLNTRLQPTQ